MDVKLVLAKGSTEGQTWQLHRRETVVGRRRDCNLRILSAQVSRRHCLLRIRDGYVYVEDLNSVNGTFINGQRVVGEQVLRPGDHLLLGPLDFLVEYEITPSAVEQPAQDVEENAVVVADEEPQ